MPTVFDGDLSPYFFPSPVPGPGAGKGRCWGRTVNLTPINDDNDYELGCEIVHPRFDYMTEHFFHVGVIRQPVTMPLQRARRYHYDWLRIDTGRDDFGVGIMEDKVS